MFHTIVVPLDGSPASEQALAVAARLSQGSSTGLHLVHVHSPYTTSPIAMEGIPVIDEDLRSLAADHELTYLRQMAAKTASAREPIMARLDGPIAFTIASYSREVSADLIVLTTHGRSGFTQLWLGSVAEALLHSLSLPMLLLRPTPAPVAPTPFRHIIVPLDGSAMAEQILPHAMTLAGHDHAEVTLLRVIEGQQAHIFSASGEYRPRENSVTAQRAAAEVYLNHQASEMLAKGYPVHTAVAVAGHPARAILTAAEEHGADLIALATRGRNGIVRTIMGSVADKVIRGGTLPVLAMRPHIPGE